MQLHIITSLRWVIMWAFLLSLKVRRKTVCTSIVLIKASHKLSPHSLSITWHLGQELHLSCIEKLNLWQGSRSTMILDSWINCSPETRKLVFISWSHVLKSSVEFLKSYGSNFSLLEQAFNSGEPRTALLG